MATAEEALFGNQKQTAAETLFGAESTTRDIQTQEVEVTVDPALVNRNFALTGFGQGLSAIQPVSKGEFKGATTALTGENIEQVAQSKVAGFKPQDNLFNSTVVNFTNKTNELKFKRFEDVQKIQDQVNFAELTIGNTFDSWLDFIDESKTKFGLNAGFLSGAFNTIIAPAKLNKFEEGFSGGLTDYAAAMAKIAMPSSRATRLIALFKKTAPSKFSTVQSGVQTTADSLRTAYTRILNVQDPINKDISDAEKAELRALTQEEKKQMTREIEEVYKKSLYQQVFRKNPDLFTAKEKLDLGLMGDFQGATYTLDQIINTPSGRVQVTGFFPDGEPDVEKI